MTDVDRLNTGYECFEDHSSSVPLLRAQRYVDDSGARSLDEFSDMMRAEVDADWERKSAELRKSLRAPYLSRVREFFGRVRKK